MSGNVGSSPLAVWTGVLNGGMDDGKMADTNGSSRPRCWDPEMEISCGNVCVRRSRRCRSFWSLGSLAGSRSTLDGDAENLLRRNGI